MNAVTQALRSARQRLRLDAKVFASLLGVEVAEVRAWESGAREARSSVLVRCARALALTVDELIDGKLSDAAVPSLFLRAKEHEGRIDDLLDLSGDLALFVETARSIDRLQRGSSGALTALPVPPAAPLYGVAEPPYKADELAAWMREKLGITTPSIPSMRDIYARLGIPIVWARREEMSSFVDGASLCSPRPTVLVHLVEGPTCWWRTRMTLAHELCHLLCDFADERQSLALVSPTSTDDAESAPRRRSAARRSWKLFKDFAWIEQRASAFASHFLVPDDALRAALAGRDPVGEEAVSLVCTSFGVGRITAVSRIKHLFRLSEETRLQMMYRPYEDKHAKAHPDLPPGRHGIREGVLLDAAAAALFDGRIDRVEAHRTLGLTLTEWLPEHSKLSEAQRAPLRSVDDDVRSIVRLRLARTDRATFHPTEVRRGAEGWYVSLFDASGNPGGEELLSFDLAAERALLSA